MPSVRTMVLPGVLMCLLLLWAVGGPNHRCRSARDHYGRWVPRATAARLRRCREDHTGQVPVCPCRQAAIPLESDDDDDLDRSRPTVARGHALLSLSVAERRPDVPAVRVLWPNHRIFAEPLHRTLCVFLI